MNRYMHGYSFLLIFFLLLAACGPAKELPPSSLPETSNGQPVEYGASLEEWDEATQGDQAQAAASEVEVIELPTPTHFPTATPAPQAQTETIVVDDDGEYLQIMWEALLPDDFTPDAIMAKYSDRLSVMEDGTAEANALYQEMQAEFNNAPANDELNETSVKLPGFITPLEYTEGEITEFLLVPYFGACIHTPAPPANQTVLVKMADGEGIKPEDSYGPVWIKGVLTVEKASTVLAEAGYYMQSALVEPYQGLPGTSR